MNTGITTMVGETSYKAARLVSGAIESHFATQIATAINRGDSGLATEPQKHVIEAIIDTAFWTSLRKEEGRSPKISLAFLPPGQSTQPLVFERRLALTA